MKVKLKFRLRSYIGRFGDFTPYQEYFSYLTVTVFFGGEVTSYQQYFDYLTATVHKSMFPGLFYPVHYPDIGDPVVVLFP